MIESELSAKLEILTKKYGVWGCDEVNCNGNCERCGKNKKLNLIEEYEMEEIYNL